MWRSATFLPALTMPAAPPADARLNVRLDPTVKSTIAEAASVLGQSLTDFAVSTLVQRSRRVLEEERVTRLSNRDRDRFLALIDGDAAPSDRLRDAAADLERRFPADA